MSAVMPRKTAKGSTVTPTLNQKSGPKTAARTLSPVTVWQRGQALAENGASIATQKTRRTFMFWRRDSQPTSVRWNSRRKDSTHPWAEIRRHPRQAGTLGRKILQAEAGGHEVFAVQINGNEVWVLTGASGSRRPTWKVRFTQTGTYRGTSAL